MCDENGLFEVKDIDNVYRDIHLSEDKDRSSVVHSSRCFCASCLKRSGFSIVELLIVISIICILLSLLFPALNRAIGTARTLTCASSMRGLGVVDSLYCGDYNDWMVYYHAPAGNVFADYVYCVPWRRAEFWEYMGLKRAGTFAADTVYPLGGGSSFAYTIDFLCPEVVNLPRRGISLLWDNGRKHAVFTDSYSHVKPIHQSEMFKKPEFVHPTSNSTYFRIKSVKSPSEKIRWCETARNVYGEGMDTRYINSNLYFTFLEIGSTLTVWSSFHIAPGYRHPGNGMNTTYYDGHVESHDCGYFDAYYDHDAYAKGMFNILE